MKNDMEEVTIKGWVARNATGKIFFYKGKEAPVRPSYKDLPRQWRGSELPFVGIPIIPKSAFPDLTWESDPREVEITIKMKE